MSATVFSGRQEGWSLVELLFALMLLSIGVVAFMLALSSSMRLARSSREKDLAVNGTRKMMEAVRNYAFSEIFSAYDDYNFDVEGLNACSSDADGHVGKVIIANSGSELRENITDDDFGLPRDLNGDGSTDGADHSGDYTLLPVTVRIEWLGAAGDMDFEMKILLAER